MRRVAVLGASGFVGEAVSRALELAGDEVKQVRAPRLQADAGTTREALRLVDSFGVELAFLEDRLQGVDAVVNCAGLAAPTKGDVASLFGANAVLPALVARAVDELGLERLVHVSSAAVQGAENLDETMNHHPLTPYAISKAVGEESVAAILGTRGVILRPTSVHGPSRSMSRAVARLARSKVSFVAGAADCPTPQVHVMNVGAACAYAASAQHPVPQVILQPWEGFTTRTFLEIMGLGQTPRTLPVKLTRALVDLMLSCATIPQIVAQGRRIEMLTFGQEQAVSWLDGTDYFPLAGPMEWKALAVALAKDIVDE